MSILSNSEPALCALAPVPSHQAPPVPVPSPGFARTCQWARVAAATQKAPHTPPALRYCPGETAEMANRHPPTHSATSSSARMLSCSPVQEPLIGVTPSAHGSWAPIDVSDICREVSDKAKKNACFSREAMRRLAARPATWLLLGPSKMAVTRGRFGIGRIAGSHMSGRTEAISPSPSVGRAGDPDGWRTLDEISLDLPWGICRYPPSRTPQPGTGWRTVAVGRRLNGRRARARLNHRRGERLLLRSEPRHQGAVRLSAGASGTSVARCS